MPFIDNVVSRLSLQVEQLDVIVETKTQEVAGSNRSNTVMMPHTPNALNDLFSQFRNALIAGNTATNAAMADPPPAGGSAA